MPLNEAFRGFVEAAIRTGRASMLDDLLTLGLDWYRGGLPTSEMPQIIFDPYPPFLAAAPSRRLSELARCSEKIANPEFVSRLQQTRASFDSDRMRGRPVLVARKIEGPYRLIEGTTRCLAIILSIQAGTLKMAHLPERTFLRSTR
jgi:hypothetical protein